jgi:hypothetical protein
MLKNHFNDAKVIIFFESMLRYFLLNQKTASYVRECASYVRECASYVRECASYVRECASYVRETASYVRRNSRVHQGNGRAQSDRKDADGAFLKHKKINNTGHDLHPLILVFQRQKKSAGQFNYELWIKKIVEIRKNPQNFLIRVN